LSRYCWTHLLRHWLLDFYYLSLNECGVIRSTEVLRPIELSHHNVFTHDRDLVKVSKVGQELHVTLFKTDTFVSEALLPCH